MTGETKGGKWEAVASKYGAGHWEVIETFNSVSTVMVSGRSESEALAIASARENAARIAELEEALRPFASVGNCNGVAEMRENSAFQMLPTTHLSCLSFRFSAGNFKRAAAALTKETGNG